MIASHRPTLSLVGVLVLLKHLGQVGQFLVEYHVLIVAYEELFVEYLVVYVVLGAHPPTMHLRHVNVLLLDQLRRGSHLLGIRDPWIDGIQSVELVQVG